MATTRNHKIRTIAQIETAMAKHQINFSQIIQAVIILIGANYASPVQDDAVIQKAKRNSDQINKAIVMKSRASGQIAYLASPVTGGGIFIQRFQQLFVFAFITGYKSPQEMARFVWGILASQAQKLLRDGKAIESDDENITELKKQAEAFAEKQLPILKALQIA